MKSKSHNQHNQNSTKYSSTPKPKPKPPNPKKNKLIKNKKNPYFASSYIDRVKGFVWRQLR